MFGAAEADSQIDLWFAEQNGEVMLIEVKARWAGALHHGIRGRVVRSDAYPFQWSAAVHALSILLLGTFENGSEFLLSGEKGSPASSLDYALAKEPNWILDFLGTDEDGRARLRQAILRTNSCLKGPGPVVVSIKPSIRRSSTLRVFLDGHSLSGQGALGHLRARLESQWGVSRGSSVEVSRGAEPSNGVPFSLNGKGQSALSAVGSEGEAAPLENRDLNGFLRNVVLQEMYERLFATNVFSRVTLAREEKYLLEDETIRRIGVGSSELLGVELDALSTRERLGFVDRDELQRAFEPFAPVRVTYTWTSVSVTAIFHYLSNVLGLPIEIFPEVSHSIDLYSELSQQFEGDRPHLMLLSPGTGAQAIRNKRTLGYESIMLLPGSSDGIVSSPGSALFDRREAANFFFLDDGPSTGYMVYETLLARGEITSHYSRTRMEPDEIFSLMSEKEAGNHAIVWFPYYHFNAAVHGCTVTVADRLTGRSLPQILFATEEAAADPRFIRALCSAIRSAWLFLREEAWYRERVVDDLLSTKDFVRFISRYGGLSSHGYSLQKNDGR